MSVPAKHEPMSDFIPVARVSDVPDPGSMLVEVGDRLVVLIHAAGHWYALDDVCTHDGGPLSEGPVDAAERTIACPRHGAKFDLATGAARDDAGDEADRRSRSEGRWRPGARADQRPIIARVMRGAQPWPLPKTRSAKRSSR